MRQFKFPQMFEAVPSGTGGVPAALQGSRPRTRLILIGLAAAAIIGLIWYANAPSSHGPMQRPVPPVRVAPAQQRDMAVEEHTIGTVVADATVNVLSQVNGQIASAAFKEGQAVKEGDVLFRLDPRPFQAALDQAEANLARDRAQLVNAERDRKRYDKLFKQNAISAQQRDQAIAQAGAYAGSVKADQAAVALAKLNMDYAVIRAPVAGKTGPIKIQPGNIVKANDTANPLVVITQIKPIKVSFSLPQTDLPRIQHQMKARQLIATVHVQGTGGATLTAPVDFVDNSVSAQSGTIELRATFPNEDGRLVPGELVDVSVNLAELRNAIVVPSQAVNVGPDGRYVYVVDKQNIARLRNVKVLNDNGTDAAVSGNVHAGDKVITVGQLRAQPGQPVSIDGQKDARGSGQ